MEIPKRRWIRLFLLFEASTFVVAALVHFGVLAAGYEHGAAGIAETVIAVVLLAAFLAAWIRPVWTRVIGLGAQSFALLGTLVGVFTIVVGVGPRTVPDIAYHAGIVVVLAWGLVVTKRALADRVRRSA